RSAVLTAEPSLKAILTRYPVTRGTMFTASTASVRPVKSMKSVTSRSTGRLTGTAGGSADATWGGPCWQPANAPTSSEHRIVETGNQRKESPCLHATVERLPGNDRR